MGLFWLAPVLPSSGVGMYWTVPFIIIWMIFRLLQVLSSPERPRLYYKDSGSPFVQAILEKCPILTEVFKPTVLWGKSGHFQTIVHVKMGRTKPRWPDAQRFHILMPDGATMSYDLFDPHDEGHRALLDSPTVFREYAALTADLAPVELDLASCSLENRISRRAITNFLG